jgi:putative methylase
MKKELEMILESLQGFENPKIKLEQYVTPPNLAAFIVTNASLFGDLDIVADLGCGTGILSVAASLMGAYSMGFDIDREAVKVALKNSRDLGCDADFVVLGVEDVCLKKLVTTIMNPPFGIQRKHADRPFLEKAFEISEVIYTIHSAGSEEFVRKISSKNGFRVTHVWKFSIPLKKSYSFHEKAFKYIPVEVFRIERYEVCNARR